jgi:hypothetical protein
MPTGNLVLARTQADDGHFILLLIDFGAGRILESSVNLTEPEAREQLADNYGEPESQIEARVTLARAHPAV